MSGIGDKVLSAKGALRLEAFIIGLGILALTSPLILARLSKRFGEGVMNGALTARVGVAAMDVCRPLPFAALPRPKVSNLIGRALTGLFQKG